MLFFFSQELFYFLLLPPIIFEAGYTLRKKDFFHNILSIVMFAVLGTLVSTFIIGYLTYLAGKLVGVMPRLAEGLESVLVLVISLRLVACYSW